MSSFNYQLKFKTKQGSIYLIEFSPFDSNPLKDQIDVFDLVLKQVKQSGNINHELLNFLASEVNWFLERRDAIIYFYCDRANIEKSKKNAHLSNQEYRSELFLSMFERAKRKGNIHGKAFDLVIRNIHIPDQEYGDHFISLITKTIHNEQLDALSKMILSLNDK